MSEKSPPAPLANARISHFDLGTPTECEHDGVLDTTLDGGYRCSQCLVPMIVCAQCSGAGGAMAPVFHTAPECPAYSPSRGNFTAWIGNHAFPFTTPTPRTHTSVVPYYALLEVRKHGTYVACDLDEIDQITSDYSGCVCWESGDPCRRPPGVGKLNPWKVRHAHECAAGDDARRCGECGKFLKAAG